MKETLQDFLEIKDTLLDSMIMLVALYLPGNSSKNKIALDGVVISCELLD